MTKCSLLKLVLASPTSARVTGGVISIATASQKGGVGKTTICVNLAYSVARRGWNTLLVDTDPQGAVGLSLARSTRARPGFYDFLGGHPTLTDLALATRLPEFSILPAGQYDSIMRLGVQFYDASRRVSDLLRAAALAGYQVVLFDTAAGLTGVTEAILKTVDYAILPQQSEPLAVRSVPHMLETLARFRAEGAPVKVAGVLLSMVMEDSPTSLQVARELRQVLPPDLMFKQSIPRLPSFLEASAHGVPVALLRQNPPPEAFLFDQIAAELETRVGLHRHYDHGQRHASLLD
jgi:chromosome partitioning protein